MRFNRHKVIRLLHIIRMILEFFFFQNLTTHFSKRNISTEYNHGW